MFSNRFSLKQVWPMIILFVFVLNSCTVASLNHGQSQSASAVVDPLPEIELMPIATVTPVISHSTSTAATLITATSTVASVIDNRPDPFYWREWPVDPELSPKAQEIILSAVHNPNLDLHTFSKIGDCQMTSGTFLGGFVNGKYAIPDGYGETVKWFSSSMAAESITAANGLGINSVLNPLFGLAAGHTQCSGNETPLDCELRTKRPAVVLIAMGTNWKPNGEVSFELHLRTVVDGVLTTGALPILATKADNIEGDWKLNQAIAQVAYDYDLPLVNVWRSVQDLPNHGLVSPKNIYLTGDGWMRRNYAWLHILEKIRVLTVNE